MKPCTLFYCMQILQHLLICNSAKKSNRRKGRDDAERVMCLTVKRKLDKKDKKKTKTSVRFYAVADDDGDYKIVKKYKLKRLKKIENGERNKEQEFVLTFENARPLNLAATSLESRNKFLYKIIQLCKENFGGQIPKLEDISLSELSTYGKKHFIIFHFA